MDNNVPLIIEKSIIRVGDSYAVTIPASWLEQHGLVKGDKVIMVANNRINIAPMSKQRIDELHKKLE